MTKEGEFLLFCSPSFSSTPLGRVVVFERRSIGYGGSSSLSSSSVCACEKVLFGLLLAV